jgi:excisionase family DNA binding protein
MNNQTEYISVRQAADLTGYTADHIRELLRSNQIGGQKTFTIWTVDKRSLEEYKRRQDQARARGG